MYHVIQCSSGQYGLEGSGVHIEDIFVSKEEICRFVARLNVFAASPVHIYELIENYFGEICDTQML